MSTIDLKDEPRVIKTAASADWRALHGGLLLVLLPLPMMMVDVVRWPWHILGPLLAYTLIVCVMPPLRRSVNYLRVGRFNGRVMTTTAVISVIASTALLLYDGLVRPDIHHLRDNFPVQSGLLLILAGVFFSVFNAVLEEVLFRGVLMDALASQVGPVAALFVQAIVFGYGHLQGYPPGVVGAVLAFIYGLMLGGLCWMSRGLGAPVLAHIAADATIFVIIMKS